MNVMIKYLFVILVWRVKPTVCACSGGFDIYFILDKSVSLTLNDFQVQTVRFVRDMVDKLHSPITRISLITFSDDASLDLPLTSDRRKIKKSLNDLKKITPYGKTYLSNGIDIVSKQVRDKGRRTASIVIVLTDGKVSGRNAFRKAEFLREQLSAIIYAVGVSGYSIKEIEKLASKPATEHVFTATNYNALHTIADKIIDTACIEVTDVKPGSVCVGIPYDVTLYGKGFTKTIGHSNISCNFRYNDTIDHVTKPSEISDHVLKCRAPILNSVNSYVTLQVTFTRNKYISSDIRVVAISCVQPDITKPLLITLLIFILIAFLALWWFFMLLPCVKPWQKPPPPIEAVVEAEPVREGSKKWPTVDASFYGGGGVGGIKPVRVKWGEKGATDEGNKLMQTPDANVIDPGDDTELVDGNDTQGSTVSSPTLSVRVAALLNCLKNGFIRVGLFFVLLYRKCGSIRPQKGGSSKLYSNSAERKAMFS